MRKGMHRGHSFPLGVPFFRKELRMWKYIVKRLLWMIPVLLGIAVVIFTIMYFLSGRSGGVNFRKRCDTGGAGGQKSRDGFG